MTACGVCGEPAELALVPELAAAVGAVTVRVQGLRVATCATGHRTMVPGDLVEHGTAAAHDQLLQAATRGLVRRREVCGACGEELRLPPRTTDTPVPFDRAGQVITLVVEAPMGRCPACGFEQLADGDLARIRDALTAVAEQATADPG